MSIYKIHKLKKNQVICSENSSGNSHRDEISRSHTIVSRSAVHTPSCRDQPLTHHRVEISRSDTIVSRSAVHTPSCRDQPFTHHRVEISRSHTIMSRSAVHTPSCQDQPCTHHQILLRQNIIQLSPLLECDPTVCLQEKSMVTRELARGWPNFSRGDKPSDHTLTRVIIGILYRICLHQTPTVIEYLRLCENIRYNI